MDLEKTVKIIFSGQDRDLGATVNSISQNITAFNASINNMATPLEAIGSKIIQADAAMLALVVGGMALAVREAGKFGSAFTEITTLVDDTGTGIGQFKNQILDYAGTSTKSIEDINKSVYAAISAGVSYKDSLDFLSVSEKLSVAGKADLESTTKVLISTLNAYGASTDEAGRYSDVLFQVVRKGQTTLPELTQSLAQVTSIAAAGGIPIETLGAAIATLTAKGLPTTTAITALKGAMTAIIKPTSEAATMAESLGIEFNAQALKAKGLDGVLADVMRTTGGNTDAVAKLFGNVEGLTGVLALGGDSATLFKTNLLEMAKATAAVQIAFDKMKENLDLAMQNLKNNANLVLIEIGSKLETGAGRLTGTLADLFKGVKIGIQEGAFDPLFSLFDQTTKDISEWGKAAAKKIPDALSKVDFSKLTEALKGISKEISGLFSGASEAEVMQQVFQKVVDSIKSLINVTAGMGQVFTPFIMVIDGVIEAFNKMDKGTQETIGNLLALGVLYKLFGPLSIAILALGIDAESTQKLFTIASAAIENGINTIKVAVLSLAMVFATSAQAAAELLDYIPGYDAQAGIDRTTERVKILSGLLDEAQNSLAASSMKTRDAFAGQGEAVDNTKARIGEYRKAIEGLPAEKKTAVNVETKTDQPALDAAHKTIADKFLPGQTTKITRKIEVKPDITQTAMTEMKEKSAIIQKSVEWKGKLDIAQIESATKIMEAAFKSVGEVFADTGKTMTSMIGSYASILSAGKGGGSFVEQQIVEESKRREKALEIQGELVKAQVDNLNARTDAMKHGQAMIQIDGQGLQPHLESFMFEILKAIQVRANAEGAQFLVGI